MEEGEPATISFFVSVVAAYACACGGWLLLHRFRPSWWPRQAPLETGHKWLDLAMVFLAAALVLGVGQVYRAGWLLPEPGGWLGDLAWTANNLIIYAPVFIILAARRQTTRSIYLSADGLPQKLLAGLGLGVASVVIFCALAGELGRLPRIGLDSVHRGSLRYFAPVFLEGVALAFAFVRLRWALGHWPALVVPGVLFAAAHIPRQLESGLGLPEVAAYFAVTGTVTVVVLHTLERSRDIVWIGIVHYLMDVAIDAF